MAYRYCQTGLALLTGALIPNFFPQDQDALLQELHNVRYFDVFEFNAVKKYWACFMCNHPEKMSELMPDGHPVIAVSVTYIISLLFFSFFC